MGSSCLLGAAARFGLSRPHGLLQTPQYLARASRVNVQGVLLWEVLCYGQHLSPTRGPCVPVICSGHTQGIRLLRASWLP